MKKKSKAGRWSGIVDITPEFKAGDPAPSGYIEWHEWAAIQHKAGLRQRPCARCGLFRFPQEKCCDLGIRGRVVVRRKR